jgi:hypothetical protein
MSDPLTPISENLPALLKHLKRWCVWRLESRDGKNTKIPYSGPVTKGKSNDPSTWLTYQTAEELFKSGSFSGYGIYTGILKDAGDSLLGLDWDHTDDSDLWDGMTEEQVIGEAVGIGSYCERSPSGTGLRVFALLDEIPGPARKGGPREVYQGGRFLTLTGHRMEGSPEDIRPVDMEGFTPFYDRLQAAQSNKKPRAPSQLKVKGTIQAHTSQYEAEGMSITIPDSGLDDPAVLEKADRNSGETFRQARYGNLTGDQVSETDLSFSNLIAPFCSSVHQIAQILQTCRPREKSLNRPDYLMRTAQKAWNDRTLYYNQDTRKLSYIDNLIKTPDLIKVSDSGECDESEKIILPVNNIALDELSDRALDALIKRNRNNPSLFVRSGELVRVLKDEDERPSVSSVDEKAARLKLCRAIEFVKTTQKGGRIIVDPPLNLVRTILAFGTWPGIPALKSLIQTPIIHPDAHICLSPGYDEKTGYYFDPGNDLTVPAIPDTPTPEDVSEAVSMMIEPFSEFPFDDDEKEQGASIAAVLAALLSVMARNLIAGPVPLLVVSKPAMGTGASKLCDIIAAISTGQSTNQMQQPDSDAEWRKAITSKIGSAPPLVVLDNYEGKLHSPYFSSLLTSQEWSDRVLGASKTVTFPHRSVWIINGNNIKIGADLPRRSYWCRINAKDAHPWERTGFTHPDLLGWTLENRGRIISAVLTVIRGWILSGSPEWTRPEGVKLLGGFESWCNVIGGILDYAGIPGFMLNQQTMYAEVDTDTPEIEAFFTKWYELYGDSPITIGEICIQLESDADVGATEDTLLAVLPQSMGDTTIGTQRFKVKLGIEIARNNQRIFPSGLMIQKAGEVKRAVKWQVVQTERNTTGTASRNPLIQRLTQRLTTNENEITLSDFEKDSNIEIPYTSESSTSESGEYKNIYAYRRISENKNFIYVGDEKTLSGLTTPPDPSDIVSYDFLIRAYSLPKVINISRYSRVSLSHRLTCSVKGCTSIAGYKGEKPIEIPLCHRHYKILKEAHNQISSSSTDDKKIPESGQ